MNKKNALLISIFFTLNIFLYTADQSILVRNTLEDINACKGKLILKLVRIWGGDEEEDENKFFKTPVSVALNKNTGLVYICDQHSHCIKVFKDSGEYVRTISRRGRGPGDTFSPNFITFSPENLLVVYELGGYRIQWFTPEGKSKRIIKYKGIAWWFGVNSKNELIVYDHHKTLESRKLVSILNQKGREIKTIGTYHDHRKSFIMSEKLIVTIDQSDNIYTANRCTPVIRQYSPEGALLLAITFTSSFEIPPVEITLNSRGDEIKINRKESNQEPVKTKVKGSGNRRSITIQSFKSKGTERVGIFYGIALDSQQRIYAVTRRRRLTEKEGGATAVSGSAAGYNRERVNYDIVRDIDINRLLVFNPEGKVIAEAQLTTFCDGIYVYGNRIFIVDALLNQRILEYEVQFE